MFIKINKKIEYALIVLNHMSGLEAESYPSARHISEKYSLPFDTTAKVMQILANHKVLSSQQGIKGGYKLEKDLAHLNYLDIYHMIEGKKPEIDCQQMQCKLIETCNISTPLSNLNQSLIYFIQSLSLKDLFNSKTPNSILKEAIHG